MIAGIGVDLVDVERFTLALTRTPTLRQRLFTPSEQDLPIAALAACFAAKEALAKSVGAVAGLGGLSWQAAEVCGVPGSAGSPELVIGERLRGRLAAHGVAAARLALSEEGGRVVALVVLESHIPAPGATTTGSGAGRLDR